MIDKAIDQYCSEFGVVKMCQYLEISQSGYYKRKKYYSGKRFHENNQLRELIKDIFEDHKGRYGAPRVHAEVIEYIPCSQKRVAKLMQELNLRARHKKKFRHQKDAESGTAENLLKREFNPEKPNQKWAGDITYLWTTKGWHYLAVVMDLYNREIIGWAFADCMDSQLICNAFFMAVCMRKPPKNCIFHSDQGSQYKSEKYKKLLANPRFELLYKSNGF